ncbi:hypothetical protein [Listeria fleischmannii]|jgi:predicted RNase H-like nuclease|uniref:Lipoprotein n=2 Tax=Listeria fleischmannii TaxID=1069827 RepID=W7DZX7_9LIST|nr:hypothetical protein [Listeria fleischmannii]EUJ59231.1 lipoprotein [Listeria fleischmannii FSL S10-1203]MBC1399314.1 hypothetical protein [Listeria fleischmannii]MBC1419541.1 hypothetical protein [Listeria fleischmannii]MBC1427752.1 hypothetical protein [Listeria fleischmannii]STY35762.1 Uncharacterised protein [Listeria fleischmannii subsp. coloradonensis]
MRKIVPILMMSLLFLTACANNTAVAYLTIDGKLTDASEVASKGQMEASGTLTWEGQAENDSSNVIFTIDSSTVIVNEAGQAVKSSDLENGENFKAIFSNGAKLVAPAPGTVSVPATKIIVEN